MIGFVSVGILIWIVLTLSLQPVPNILRNETPIDQSNIRRLMQDQIDMGPRVPGSQASFDFQTWLHQEVDSTIWNITTQSFIYRDVELRNYWITSANSDEFPEYIIGAHYDSRAIADKDGSGLPVPGANDGASGIAGQLELMKHIPAEFTSRVGFVMFDGEDQGSNGMRDSTGLTWAWIVGSQHFVDEMTPEEIANTNAFVLFDMIGDDDLSLPYEPNSDQNLIDEIWGRASELGYGSIFVNSRGTALTDDHVPFLRVNIPSIDIIDFTYPEHHTSKDDMDHISEESVAIVIDVILTWLFLDVAETLSLTGDYSTLLTASQTSTVSNPSTTSTFSPVESETNDTPIPLIGSSIITLVIIRLFVKYYRNP